MASAPSEASRRRSSDRSRSLVNRVANKIAKARDRSRTSMDLPERFKNDDEEDVDDGTGVGGDENALFAQQSVYGMLAATQSKANFPNRFQQESGSESEPEEEKGRKVSKDVPSTASKEEAARRRSSDDRRQMKLESKGHRKKLNEHKLMRSFLKPIRERTDSSAQDPMTQSQFLPPREERQGEAAERAASVRTDAPILDRKLQAMAKVAMEASTTSASSRKSREGKLSEDKNKSLPQIIADMFQFEEPEEVVSEYPCWYLQNVLLQGFMYITQKHVCFYSYLNKKTNFNIKTGHLGKQGKHSYGYKRYWMILKGDNFSYYKSSSEPYFPLGVVDLRYAISADLSMEKGKETSDFTITTHNRVYQYRADTPSSAKDWVKQLQKVIFRTHNDGDAVKISLPIENILDAEPTGVVDFAETVKLRVVDNEQTFAVDEYFFTFFSFAEEAMNVLNVLTSGNEAKKALVENDGMSALQKMKTPPSLRQNLSNEQSPHSQSLPRQIQEPVRSTLSPLSADGRSSPRLSGEVRRSSADYSRSSMDRERASFDRGRRSVNAASRGSKSPLSPSVHESNESFVTSSEQASESTNDEDAVLDANMSASQMLTGDRVFRGPTLRMPQPRRTVSGSTVERPRQESQQSSRESSTERIRVQPPSREPTDRLQRRYSGGSDHTVEADDRLRPADTTAPGRLVRGISTPLQHAMTVAGMVRSSSKRMSSYLSSSPKTYIGNWSAAIAGGKRHYTDVEGLAPDDSIREPEQEMDVEEHERRFREHFGLVPTEKLVSVFYCWLHKTVPLYGKIYMGTRRFCFRSLWYGTKTKLVIPYKDIINVQKQRGFRWGYPGMVLVIRGYEELFFDFPSNELRDDAVVTVLRFLETVQAATEQSMVLTEDELQDAEDAAAENQLLQAARKDGYADHDVQLPHVDPKDYPDAPPVLFDDPSASVLEFKPKQSMRIVCLTIGSRGDVQPYIALCKGLSAEGHRPKIVTHAEFRGWVEKHGIDFAEIEGDPAELMKVCVENGMFTPSFFLEVNSKFRVWLDGLLSTSWEACKDADLLIESPSAMGGIHIAEALEIPYFRAFGMPWTRTRAYPHAFAVPNRKLGGGYNYMTYTFFDNMFWQMLANQVNKWRGKDLGLAPTSLDLLQQNKVPFLYNFSPSVVVPPLDFSDWIKVTGYWFLDEGDDYQPPADLAAFIQKARDDDQKLVYIGFGSVTVSDSRQLTQQIVDAVVRADVRCILSKGWSDRFDQADPTQLPIELPACVHQIRSVPHDWLFRRIDAVVHHGGAGTTGASLRAGIPTIIKPFFGDQFFFATRVEDLNVGMYLKKVTANQLGKALWIATHDARMRKKATLMGESIRGENGVDTAIKAIYRDLEYAKSLIKKRHRTSAAQLDGGGVDLAEDTEENWTFIESTEGLDTDPVGAIPVGTSSGDASRRSSQQSPRGSSSARQMGLGSLVMRGGK